MKNFQKKYVSGMLALFALVLPTMGRAFELTPMTQTFEPAGRNINRTFEVKNDSDEGVAVTLTIKARTLDATGAETLRDTKDFAIFPTQIMLKSKAAQVVRVQWQGDAFLSSEQSYRIIAEEVPLKAAAVYPSGSVMAIKLVLRFGGTIYVASPLARADVVIASAKAVKTPKGELLDIVLENRGTRHAIIDQPSVNLTSGEMTGVVSSAAVDKALAGENILAGSSRSISLPWPENMPVGPVEAKLKASFLQ